MSIICEACGCGWMGTISHFLKVLTTKAQVWGLVRLSLRLEQSNDDVFNKVVSRGGNQVYIIFTRVMRGIDPERKITRLLIRPQGKKTCGVG